MTLGMVGGGRVSGSSVACLPNLPRDLGPIAAQSYRLASRIANSLGAGYPAKNFEPLNGCDAILICIPEDILASVTLRLASKVDLTKKVVLLCDSKVDSSALDILRMAGASAGSMRPIDGVPRFVVEGDRLAIRLARQLLRHLGARVEEIPTVRMPLFNAWLELARGLVTPSLEAAVMCLHEAGLPKPAAAKLSGELFERAVRAYCLSGKRSWSGALADGNQAAVMRQLKGMRGLRPVARFYRNAAINALELLGSHAALRRALADYPIDDEPRKPMPTEVRLARAAVSGY